MQFLSMITMDDVMLVVDLIDQELMILGVVLALAVIATFAVMKLQKPLKKLIRGTSWVAFLIVLVLILNMMVSGPLYSLVNMVLREPAATNTDSTGETGEGEAPVATLSEQSISNAKAVAEQIAAEGFVLLKNDGILPLAEGSKLNTFGWSATNPVYGGVGSGALNNAYEVTSFLDSLTAAGLEYNTALTDWYTTWRAERPSVGMWSQDWTVPEPTQAEYESAGIYDSALAYSDTAIFFIARSGGEGADLPTVYDEGLTEGSSGNVGDSEYAEDLGADKHYLELTTRERATLEALNEKFENIIVVVNVAAAMELGFINEYESIKAAVLIPGGPGHVGFAVAGKLLTGEINFSGKTSDTYLYDLTHAPTWNNFGHFEYTNMSEFVDGELNSTTPTFVNYVENIYVGYKFWETADDEGLIDYDAEVVYPFGYGLSYTTFTQELLSVANNGGQITVTVNVTNTGDVAGKEIVQVYYNPPYTNGGIEKASANLIAFAKTAELAPGASETVELTFATDEMSSFDSTANGGEGAYVLEAGDYVISINSDAHTEIDSETLTLAASIGRASDVVAAVNQLQYAEDRDTVTYLSRKDGFANYDEVTAAPTDFEMSDSYKAGFYNHVNYVPTSDPNDVMPTTGANNNLTMNDMRGLDYDDPLWEYFLDQLTVEDMVNLIAIGGYQSTECRTINKTTQTDLDGPASLNNTATGAASIGFPTAVILACTWNVDLAQAYGDSIGEMAEDLDVSGWYAPAMNIHRSAFSGRNFEYPSEDAYHSGMISAAQVAGARERGVYSFIKHFAINDQETNRTNMVCTWTTEQAAREVYMKSFEIAVKVGGAQAVMSSFNYIGNEYAGACDELLNQILREEWGFRGMVLTDYFGGYGYQDADIQIRNGGDICLSPMGSGTAVLDDQSSATAIKYARQAVKNICYTTCNSRAYATEVVVETPTWQIVIWTVSGIIIAALALVEVKLVMNYVKRTKAAA